MRYGNSEFVPIILGTGLNTYGVARAMHEAYGVRSLALGRASLPETAHSDIVDVRTYPDFDDPERIIEILTEVAKEFPDQKRVLIANIELYTNIVMANRDALEAAGYLVPIVGEDLGQRLMNKTDFYRTCAELGIPHPETVIATADSVAADDFGEDLPFEYPVILKPSDTDLYPRLHFEGHQKVYLVDSAEDLRKNSRRIYDAGYVGDLIVQEYLAGDESVMRVVNTYSDRSGKMKFASAAQIVLGVWDPELVGNYNAVVSMYDAELIESIRTLLNSVGYVGPANFDVMYDRRTGTSKLLEINLRQGAASYYTAAAGGNLARCYVEDLVEQKPLPEKITTKERLWENVPYPLVRWLSPKSLWPLITRARRHGVTHTLYYAADRSPKRLATVALAQARNAKKYWTYRNVRPEHD